MATVTADYLETYGLDRAESSTRQAALHVRSFYEWLTRHGITLDYRLGVVSLQDYRAALAREPDFKNSYKNIRLSHVRTFLNWARKRGVVKLSRDEISDSLECFRTEHKLPRVLTHGEIRRLVQACIDHGSTTGRYVLAGLLTGMRKREIGVLSRSHVDELQIVCYASKTREQRVIPLEYVGVGRRLFTEPKRYDWDFQKRHWVKIRARAGLKGLPFKVLRATFSSYAKSAGVNHWTVAQILGHTVKTAARHYDRLVAGVSGDSAPEWYGCADLIERAIAVLPKA